MHIETAVFNNEIQIIVIMNYDEAKNEASHLINRAKYCKKDYERNNKTLNYLLEYKRKLNIAICDIERKINESKTISNRPEKSNIQSLERA